MKKYISITNAGYISIQLHNIFNHSNNLNLTKFKSTKIKIFEENNFNNIEFNGFKYIFDNLK